MRITEMAHIYAALALNAGDIAVDATVGTGRDTLFLAQKVGPEGRVYAFDIQEEAICRTAQLLKAEGHHRQVRLIQGGHEKMADYVAGPVSVVMFNLGYLPGGDHRIVTGPETTLTAIQAALGLLRAGGLVTIAVYPGHPGGDAERDALTAWCRELSSREYRVISVSYLNRVQDPPALILIFNRPG